MKKLCLLLPALLLGYFIQAQTNYYTRIPGAWNNHTNVWSTVSDTGAACFCNPGNILAGNKVAHIYNSITATTLTGETGTAQLIIENGDSLTITTSTFAMSGGSIITVNTGGVLIVNANMTLSGSASVTNNGRMYIHGNVTTSGSASFGGAGLTTATGTVAGPGTISVLPPVQNNANTTYGGIMQDGSCGTGTIGNQTECFGGTPTNNTGFGWASLGLGSTSNPYCVDNTGVGMMALTSEGIAGAGYNTGIGCQALQTTQNGQGNTGVGSGALEYLKNGNDSNTAVGWDAMQGSVGGNSNTAIGTFAFDNGNNAGTGNCSLGYKSLKNNNAASYNIAIGYNPLSTGTGTGSKNIAIGLNSMENNNTGSENACVGNATLITNTIGSGNAMFGNGAGATNTTGSYNTGVGQTALDDNTIGNFNVAVGYQALLKTQITYSLTAVGTNALENNLGGGWNTALGYSALGANTTGSWNTATGYEALNTNTVGSDNTANGAFALFNNTESYNTATGYYASYSNGTGSNNTANGYRALYHNTVSNNTATGFNAMFGGPGNYTGGENTAYGYQTLYNIATGSYNTAAGYEAMFGNGGYAITGSYNTANGYEAMFGYGTANVAGSYNTADGYQTLHNVSTGSYNTAAGYDAMFGNGGAAITGQYNAAVGYQSLYDITGGSYNTAEGYESSFSNKTGYYNVAIGYKALFTNTGTYSLTAVGSNALEVNTGGSNSAFGYYALGANTTGAYNTGIGTNALSSNITGSDNTALGYYANVTAGALTNATAIGYEAASASNNQMELGNNNVSVTIGMSTFVPVSATRLELNTYHGAAPFTVNATGTPPAYINGGIGTGWSGLRFDDLTSSSTPAATNPGPGVLALDGNGNVIYVQSSNAGIGTCLSPTTISTANAGIDLGTNGANFYFQGQGIGVSDVLIGTPVNSCTVPTAKLDVAQFSGSTSGSIGIFVQNNDVPTAAKPAVIGIQSYIPNNNISCTPPYNTTVAGWFEAVSDRPGVSCFQSSSIGYRENYAIFIPGSGPYNNLSKGGGIVIGYAFNTLPPVGNLQLLNVNSGILTLGGYIPSDSTIKKNITPFNSGISVIRELNPVYYQYNGIGGFDSTGHYIGLLAQNLNRVAPYGVRSEVVMKDTISGDTATILDIYEQAILYTAVNAIKQVDSTVTSNQNKDSIVQAAQQLSIDSLRNKIDSFGIINDTIPAMLTADSSGTILQTNGTNTTQLQAVGANSFYTTSDQRCKTSITNIPDALSLVNKLNGIYFNWNQAAYPWKHFPSGQQIGFIAQQVDTVVPQVINQNDSGYYTMDYGRITPLLVDAIKQQKQTNDSLRYTLDSLRTAFQNIQSCLNRLCDYDHRHNAENGNSGDSNTTANVQDITLSGLADAPLLYQNIPNPFSSGTKINYYLPQGTMGATIVFYDSYGNQIKQVQLSQTGNGTLNITPDNLKNGIYSYSLVINGNVIDTKRMVLQK